MYDRLQSPLGQDPPQDPDPLRRRRGPRPQQRVGATVFPHNIGLGATRDAKLVEDSPAHRPRGRATGMDWIFAPCVTSRATTAGAALRGLRRGPGAGRRARRGRGAGPAGRRPERPAAGARLRQALHRRRRRHWGTGRKDEDGRFPWTRATRTLDEADAARASTGRLRDGDQGGVGSIMPSYN